MRIGSHKYESPFHTYFIYLYIYKYLFIYLAAPGLSCGTRDLQLQHVNS